jgi:hypothetical protein
MKRQFYVQEDKHGNGGTIRPRGKRNIPWPVCIVAVIGIFDLPEDVEKMQGA